MMFRGVLKVPGCDPIEIAALNFHALRHEVYSKTFMCDEKAELEIVDADGKEVFRGTVKRWRERVQ